MKTECPVCGQPRNNASDHAGQEVVCRICRTRFEVRHVATDEEKQAAAEFRVQLLTVFLPIVLISFVVICGISAEVLDSRYEQPESVFVQSSKKAVPVSPSASTPEPPASSYPQQTSLPSTTKPGTPSTVALPPPSGQQSAVSLKVVPVRVHIPATDPPAPRVPDRRSPFGFKNNVAMDFSDDLSHVAAFAKSQLVKVKIDNSQVEVLAKPAFREPSSLSHCRLEFGVGTKDGRVVWVRPTQRNVEQTMPTRHSGPVIGTLPEFVRIWSCGTDGALIAHGGNPINSRKLQLPGTPISVQFRELSRSVIVGMDDRRVLIGRGHLFEQWEGFRSATPAQYVALSRDQKMLVVAGGNQAEVRRNQTFDLQQVFSLPVPITCAALSADGDMLALGGQDKRLYVYSTWSRRVLATHQFESIPVLLKFHSYGRSPIAAATDTGEYFNINMRPALANSERMSSSWTPLASRSEANQWKPLSSFMNPEMETMFLDSSPYIRDLLTETGRQRHRVQYLQQQGNQVIAYGCGLRNVKRVLWFDGYQPKELPVQVATDNQIHLQWSPNRATIPILMFETQDAAIMTVPYDLEEAEDDSFSDARDNETLIVMPDEPLTTAKDKFRLLVLPPNAEVSSEITGRGVIVAQAGSQLPTSVRGQISVIRTNSHTVPANFSSRLHGDHPTDRIYLNPIPMILPDL